jgi:hypothetical protein
VTKARLLIADGAYAEAKQVLSLWTNENISDQWHLIQSLALACLGERQAAFDAYRAYTEQFPPLKSADPRAIRMASYYQKVRERCASPRRPSSQP